LGAKNLQLPRTLYAICKKNVIDKKEEKIYILNKGENCMNNFEKIKTLYNLSKDYGYSENEIINAENNLTIKFPKILRDYYSLLGKNKKINRSFNRLLKINGEVGFADDNKYFVFYEENQSATYWAINKNDMDSNNPKVYGNYDPRNCINDWFLYSETIEDFLLSMAYWVV
jgi:hypothetical protein